MSEAVRLAQDELSSISEKIAALRARREMRELRLIQLESMVGEAKRRVSKQPKAQEFLERLQERCHQKSVGLYEELLSAVVQDVLPGEKNVGLTLKTARGLPSLDIEMVKPGGERESILEGSGGALTNILSAGLRVIALARSGAYPFLVLDEPDCWLKPTLVPQFANVLGQIAKDLGIQMLIISHHDPEAFSGFSSQVRLEKRGGSLECLAIGEPAENEWEEAGSGIRELRFFDFMSHEKTVIPLSPGVTCLTGANDIGKSAIVSGLRALFYGSGSDTAIAHGKPMFKIEGVFHDGSLLSMERYLKKSPKQRWRYYVPGQEAPVQDSSPKDGPPDWLDHIAKIAKTEDLDIAFANQKSPVFLLDQAPSRRASILAVGRESMHLQRLIAKNKERNMLDGRLVRDGESEGAAIKRELKELESIDELADQALMLRRVHADNLDAVVKVQAMHEKLGKALALTALIDGSKSLSSLGAPCEPSLTPMHELGQSIRKLAHLSEMSSLGIDSPAVELPSLAHTEELRQALSRLVVASLVAELSDLPDLPAAPKLFDTERLASLMSRLSTGVLVASLDLTAQPLVAPVLLDTDRLRDMGRRASRLRKVIAAAGGLLELPDSSAPPLVSLDSLAGKLGQLSAVLASLNQLPAHLAEVLDKQRNVAMDRDGLFDMVGGKCPTCGSAVTTGDLAGDMGLLAHKHGEE